MKHHKMLFVFEAIEQFKTVTTVEFLGRNVVSMHLESKQVDMFARGLIDLYLQRKLFRFPNQVLHDLVRVSPIRIRWKSAVALIQAELGNVKQSRTVRSSSLTGVLLS